MNKSVSCDRLLHFVVQIKFHQDAICNNVQFNMKRIHGC